jgi:glycosyltransferase involved in cell wall biosynthesis
MIKISAVIATKNRKDSLYRTLKALGNQTCKLQEVIIVDSSDEKLVEIELSTTFDGLDIKYFTSEPSVCIQRNIGIRKSISDYIFICDDDVEPEPGYLLALSNYIERKSLTNAVSGLILEKDKNEVWVSQHTPKFPVNLLFSFIFQLSVWGEVNEKTFKSLWIKPVINFYQKRGNGFSLAGWPVIIDFKSPVFKTDIYGLGASIIKKELLINNPFDEVLDNYGIGDNYGICIGFPDKVAVLTGTFVNHHKESENRLDSGIIYYRRVLALHYFLRKSKRFNTINTLWLLWSLIGSIILFVKNRQFRLAKAAVKSIVAIVIFDNPYYIGSKKNNKNVCPNFN